MKTESRIQESGESVVHRAPAKCFADLIVWQKAHQFALGVYRFTEIFPQKEIYGLTSQFRRAAISIPANIAEGFKKRVRADKARFLNIAQGSLEECRYYLILAKDLNYGDSSALLPLLEETSKLLEAYASKILASVF
ncbi:MAG: four helix bundle protein [Verrucomicrobiota bacterium]